MPALALRPRFSRVGASVFIAAGAPARVPARATPFAFGRVRNPDRWTPKEMRAWFLAGDVNFRGGFRIGIIEVHGGLPFEAKGYRCRERLLAGWCRCGTVRRELRLK